MLYSLRSCCSTLARCHRHSAFSKDPSARAATMRNANFRLSMEIRRKPSRTAGSCCMSSSVASISLLITSNVRTSTLLRFGALDQLTGRAKPRGLGNEHGGPEGHRLSTFNPAPSSTSCGSTLQAAERAQVMAGGFGEDQGRERGFRTRRRPTVPMNWRTAPKPVSRAIVRCRPRHRCPHSPIRHECPA